VRPFGAYLRKLWRFNPRGLLTLSVLTLLGGATESLGVLLLVPLLVVVGAADGAPSAISDTVESALSWASVPFTLEWILAVYVALISVRAAVGYARTMVGATLRLSFVDHLRFQLFDAIAHADWRFHVERRSTDISHTLMSDLGRISTGTTLAIDAFSRLVVTSAYVFVAFQLSVPITTAALLVAVLLGRLLWPQVSRSRQVGEMQTERGKRSFSSQAEFLSGMKLAKSHGNEQRHVDLFQREMSSVREATVGFQQSSAITQGGFQVGTVIAVAGLVWVAVTQLEIPSAELLTLVVVVSRIAPAASGILRSLQGAANMLPAFENADRLLVEAQASAERLGEPRSPMPLASGVQFENVSFSYGRETKSVLSDVSFHVPAKRTTALVGSSGAGKTTTADIILGLLRPTSGRLLIDGQPIDQFGLATWRAGLAYVPQEPFLFHDTLEANITWGVDPSDGQLEDLIEAAALSSVVVGLPDGVKTVVGDRGHRLSGGERQRVALARALMRQPTVLVLDEATSALDTENERLVQQAIDRLHGELTIVVIAHRLSTVRNADQIVVLEEGGVVESGTWHELTKAGGKFASMAADVTSAG